MTHDSGSLIFSTLWPIAYASTVKAGAGTILLLPMLGYDLPIVTACLAVLGVLMARPLSPRGPMPMNWPRQILVTAILCLIALTWVVDTHPRPLFTFVISIGLGFAGFSVIELIGQQLLDLIQRWLSSVTGKGE